MKITWNSIKKSAGSRLGNQANKSFNPLASFCEIDLEADLIRDLYNPGNQSELFECLQRFDLVKQMHTPG